MGNTNEERLSSKTLYLGFIQTILTNNKAILGSFTTGRKRHIDLDVDSSCFFKSELKNTDSIFILRAFILNLYVGVQIMKYEAC